MSDSYSTLQRLIDMRKNESAPGPVALAGPSLALLRGLANAKSGSKAKEKAQELAEAKSQPIVETRTYDPTTGRTKVDLKGIVLGDEDTEMEEAAALPQIELAAAVNPYLKQLGYREAGAGGELAPDIKEKIGSLRGQYHLAREGGADPIASMAKAAAIKLLPGRFEKAAAENAGQTVNRGRIARGVNIVKEASPVIAEADRQRRMNRQERNDRRTAVRQLASDIGKTIVATDFTAVDPSEWVASVAAQNGLTEDDLGDAFVAQIERTGRQQVKKAHEGRFKEFRQDNALAQFETFEQAAEAFGEPLETKEAAQLRADWQEKRSAFTIAKRAADQLAEVRDATIAKLANATTEKPMKFQVTDARALTGEDLAGYFGAPNVDQASLVQTAKRKIGIDSGEFDKLTAERARVVSDYNKLTSRLEFHGRRAAQDEEAKNADPYAVPKYPRSATEAIRLENEKARLEGRMREIDGLREPLVRSIGTLKEALGGKRSAPAAGPVLTKEQILARLRK